MNGKRNIKTHFAIIRPLKVLNEIKWCEHWALLDVNPYVVSVTIYKLYANILDLT